MDEADAARFVPAGVLFYAPEVLLLREP